MSEIEILAAVMFVLFAALISTIAVAFHLHSQHVNHSESPLVRDTAHEAANEATVVKQGLRRLAKEPDPLRALVKAIRGCQREHRQRHVENGR
jgi:hypothetical protein